MVTAWQQERRRKQAGTLRSEAAAGLEAILGGLSDEEKRKRAEEDRAAKLAADEADLARKGVEATARMEQDQARTGILREKAKIDADRAAAEGEERATRAGVLRQKQAKDEADAKRADGITSMARRMDTLTSRADVEKAASAAGMQPDDFLAAVAEQQEKAISEQAKGESRMDLDDARAEKARADAEKAKRAPVIRPRGGAAKAPGAADPTKAVKDATKLRVEYRKAPAIVKYDAARADFAKMEQAAKNPSAGGDLALVFSFMKVLDPGSTVREGEFANAQNAAGIPDRIRNEANRVASGERLSPQQRADFLRQAKSFADAYKADADKERAFYRGLAERSGFSPIDVVGEDEAPAPAAAAPAAPSTPAPAAGGKVKVTKDGETFEIDAADLPAALADDFKVVRRG